MQGNSDESALGHTIEEAETARKALLDQIKYLEEAVAKKKLDVLKSAADAVHSSTYRRRVLSERIEHALLEVGDEPFAQQLKVVCKATSNGISQEIRALCDARKTQKDCADKPTI
mmetsp:Transcript_43053/g.71571  ORF Transcript_43053/g.71571 Transcript_43053/m.71571 type:complete len:115 (+) Transcript_43053:59-403(+)|eukprot:CAMPEP_0119308384 /NCGR_PEP_ID=MMETSP1333-20130426/10409_1 /TAXON_ID=418940 /ORGANISM="Scyphosphaera apsteinii, Strain RCC1455" /LENGTH=114 /DNA_ID=CAMNT_0007312135 /DNA_START=44 /DNA_END=388 /DNA_ORIENTATION=+